MCCRFASISPMSRLAMEWAAASRGCRATATCGARTAKSPRRIRISRCGVWVTPRRSSPFSTNCLPRGASVPNTGLADAVQLRAEMPLFTGPNWDFGSLRRVYEAVEKIAFGELGLDIYPVQIEVITSEQMLDAYSSVGLPLMYRHWSFGKRFAYHETLYRKGLQGLAYEIVINSNPVICYIMEENSMTMQTLVIAHAAFGHNHFFKNNYVFRQWTNAEGILDYLAFAKRYIAACEDRHGREDVEAVLDSAHALMEQGVFRYRRPPKPSKERTLEKRRRRLEYEEVSRNELWRTLPAGVEPPAA